MRRVLFVSRHYASDFGSKVGGVFQRMRMLLDAAARSCDALDVLFFVDPQAIGAADPSVPAASLRRDWGITAAVHFAPRATMRHGSLVQTVRALLDFRAQDDYFRFNGVAQRAAIGSLVRPETGLIVAHRLYVGSAVVAAPIGDMPVVMDLDDIEHRNRARQIARRSAATRPWFARLELPALRQGELATIGACRTVFVCSNADREYLAVLGATNTTVVPNAMRFDDGSSVGPESGSMPPSVPTAKREASEPATLFFIGAYGYPPNADAAEHLIGTIFPLVRRQRPDARLLIVGESVEKLPSHARRPPGVEFVGFVPDLTDVYRRATVVCCPILAGGGTRIKIIEAAAARKAIVSTTIGAEGLDFDDEVEILRRDTPQAFADACVALIDDPARAAALGAAAFAKARSLYERGAVVARIADAFAAHAR